METYQGHVRTPQDAIILFEACRLGLLPRVQRRLSEKERQSIKSGSIFVWDEREAGMRRWTDGKSWSASRVSGSFLTYREMEGKRGNAFAPPVTNTPTNLAAKRSPNSEGSSDEGVEGPDGYRYKPDGLMKQSFSITTANHQKLHLISYYARSHPTSSQLMQPSNDPALKNIRPAKGMYPESTVHESQNVPAMQKRPLIITSYPSSAIPLSAPPYGHSPHPGVAAHPHSYSASSVSPAYGWPPSPVSTPPAGYPAGTPVFGAGLPPPQPAVSPMLYERTMPHPTSSPMQYDRPSLPAIENGLPPRTHMVSPAMANHLNPNSSPRLSNGIPPPIMRRTPDTFNSPVASLHQQNTSPRPPYDRWDVSPIRSTPTLENGVPNGERPGSASSLRTLEVHEPTRFGEDIRALKMLDKTALF